MRSRCWIQTPVSGADCSIFYERKIISSNAQLVEALLDSIKRSFIAVMFGLMQRSEHVFSKRGRHNNTSRNCALVTVFQLVVFDD